jgi:hypothetical protein
MRAARRATALVAPRAWTSYAEQRRAGIGRDASLTAAEIAAAVRTEAAAAVAAAAAATAATLADRAAADAIFVHPPAACTGHAEAPQTSRADAADMPSAHPAGSLNGRLDSQGATQWRNGHQSSLLLLNDVRTRPPPGQSDEPGCASADSNHLRDQHAVQGMLEEASELLTGVLRIGVGDSITTCDEQKAAAINQYVRRNKLRSEKLIMFHHDKQRWMDAKLRQGEDKRLLFHNQDLKRQRQLERQEEARKRHARVRARKEAENRAAE